MDWIVCLLARLAVALVQVLPLETGFVLGSWLGRAAWVLLPGFQTQVRRGLQVAFGREWSETEITACGKKHAAWLGANLLAGVKAAAMRPEEIARRVEIDITETVRKRRGEKPGRLVALVSHQSNWELFALMSHTFSEVPIGSVYQPLENPFLDRYLRRVRSAQGVRLFSRHEGFMETLAFLRGGNALAVLVDQHAGDGGVWTPLFDRLALTSPLAAMLALRADADLLPISIQTLGVARWKITASEILTPQPGEDAEELTARINVSLEKQIRQSPADWLWGHERWKTPLPRFLTATHPRGTAFPPGYDRARLQPFRLLVWVFDFAAVAAVRSLAESRPDLVLTILVSSFQRETWAFFLPHLTLRTLEEIRGEMSGMDAALLLSESPNPGVLALIRNVPRRVGLDLPGLREHCNQLVRFRRKLSCRERWLQFVETLGAHPQPWTPQVPGSESDEEAFARAVTVMDFTEFAVYHDPREDTQTEVEIPAAGPVLARTKAWSARIVLSGLPLPANHRIFLRIVCERPKAGTMHAHFTTDTEPHFLETNRVTKPVAAGRVTELFAYPCAEDLAGSLNVTLGAGPAEYRIYDLEIRAVPVAL